MASNKQLAHAFTEALKHLSTTNEDKGGKYEYICWALRRAFVLGTITNGVYLAAKSLINQRIRSHSTFSDWMEAYYPWLKDSIADDDRYNKSRKMQKTRRAWLNSLIEELSI